MIPVHMSARLVGPPSTIGSVRLRFARRVLSATVQQLLVWQERASERHHLMTIDDHGLSDAGLTRAALAREIGKPFWRP